MMNLLLEESAILHKSGPDEAIDLKIAVRQLKREIKTSMKLKRH
jgi:hypothetical protein